MSQLLHDPFKAMSQTPVIPGLIPTTGAAAVLYTVPGGINTQFNLKISNGLGNGDAHFWVGFGTSPTTAPTVWLETGSLIPDGVSLTLEQEDRWVPELISIWVMSDTGGVAFTLYGNEWSSVLRR